MIGYPGIYLKTGPDSPGSWGLREWMGECAKSQTRAKGCGAGLAGWRDGGGGRRWAHCSSGRSPRRMA